MSQIRSHSVLPGFNLALGFALLYLSLLCGEETICKVLPVNLSNYALPN